METGHRNAGRMDIVMKTGHRNGDCSLYSGMEAGHCNGNRTQKRRKTGHCTETGRRNGDCSLYTGMENEDSAKDGHNNSDSIIVTV